MNTRRIQIAFVVAKLKSFSRAAKALHLTQPTVSGAIQTLEQELGFPLFERNNRGISITANGKEFFAHASIIDDHMNQIAHIAQTDKYCRFHLLAFFCNEAFRAYETFCLNHVDAKETDISYYPYTASVEDAVEALSEGDADLALAICRKASLHYVQSLLDGKFDYFVFDAQQTIVVTAPDHPLQHEAITLQSLGKYNMIVFEDVHRANYFMPLEQLDIFHIKKCIYAPTNEMRRSLVLKGAGFFFGEKSYQATLEKVGLKCRPLEGADVIYVCIYNKGGKSNPFVKEYLSLLQEEFAKNEPGE